MKINMDFLRRTFIIFGVIGLVFINSAIYAEDMSSDITLSKTSSNMNDVKTSMATWLLRIDYDASYTKYLDPITVSDSQTTALTALPEVIEIDPQTGARSPRETVTSYSKELQKAYRYKTFHINAAFQNDKQKIVQSWNPAITMKSGSVVHGEKKLTLSFDGTNSKAFLESRSIPNNKVSIQGLQEPGDAVRFYVYIPIHVYGVLNDPKNSKVTVSGGDEVVVESGKRRYVLSKKYGLAIISCTEENPKGLTKTAYDDFKMDSAGVYYPWKIVESKTDSTGQILDSRIITFNAISFAPTDRSTNDIFTISFPRNTKFSKNSSLHGLLDSAR